MPIETSAAGFLDSLDFLIFVKIFFILFVIFYAVFALMLYRQIQIMTRALPTAISPFLRFLGIIHIGVALAVLFFIVGAF